jgi:hypothetical protein
MATTAHAPRLRRLVAAATLALVGNIFVGSTFVGNTFAAAVDAAGTLMTDRLRAVSHQKECRVATTGRRTGNPHTVTTWFVVEGDSIYLGTLDAGRDWVRNASAARRVAIDFGTLAVTGTFTDVTDPQVAARVREALERKYWMAWFGGWFGKGPERTFRVGDLQVTGDRGA